MADHPAKQTVRLTLDDLATIGAMYEETEDLNIAAAVAAALAAVRTTTREVLTVAEAAETIGLSEKTIRRAIRSGQLPAFNVRNRVKIYSADLKSWLESNPAPVSPADLDFP